MYGEGLLLVGTDKGYDEATASRSLVFGLNPPNRLQTGGAFHSRV